MKLLFSFCDINHDGFLTKDDLEIMFFYIFKIKNYNRYIDNLLIFCNNNIFLVSEHQLIEFVFHSIYIYLDFIIIADNVFIRINEIFKRVNLLFNNKINKYYWYIII